jgi:hypothetical protein
MFRLIFFEELGVYQRLLSQTMAQFVWQSLLQTGVFVVFFALISLPFMYAFAAVYRDAKADLLWLRKLMTRGGLVAVSVAAGCIMVYLLTRPVYDHQWYSEVRVEQRYTLGADSSMITIRGSEYLDGLLIQDRGKDTVFHGRTTFHAVHPVGKSDVAWCSVDAREFEAAGGTKDDTLRTLERRVDIHSQFRPLRVGITYASSAPFEVQSPWSHGADRGLRKETDRSKAFTWYSFPDTNLVVPVTFSMKAGQKITERIEVIYDSLAYPLVLDRALTNISKRTIVTSTDTVVSGQQDMRASLLQ